MKAKPVRKYAQPGSFSDLRTSSQSSMLCMLSVIRGWRLARRRGRRSFRWAEVRGLSLVSGSSPFAGSQGRRSSMVEQPPQGVLIPRQSLAHRFACPKFHKPSVPGVGGTHQMKGSHRGHQLR